VTTVTETQRVARPFLKWAGGKTQLLDEIESRLPDDLKNGIIDTYVEPFLGGGAVFFFLAQKYESLKQFYLFDINDDLVNCYKAVKEGAGALIRELAQLEKQYMSMHQAKRRVFFLGVREAFNKEKLVWFNAATAAKLIFLNKTCYNGLYRVNRKGEFNVPFGDYKSPTICDAENLRIASLVLKKAAVISGDFESSAKYITRETFVYFDPPYRPLSRTASFTSYSKDNFGEVDQIRLAEFCKGIDRKGGKFLLSNSDPKNEDATDKFFEEHYYAFKIETVKAARPINCKGEGRGLINELIITNY
jgi:DNA adenine methylase